MSCNDIEHVNGCQIRKENFIRKYGLGVEHEKCKICNKGNSYPVIIEDHSDDSVHEHYEISWLFCSDCTPKGRMHAIEDHLDDCIHVLYEISGFFCSDCITNGRMQTYVANSLSYLEHFWEIYEEAAEASAIFEYMSESEKEEEMDNFSDSIALVQGMEFEVDIYLTKAESMKKAMLEFDGTPVKMIINTGGEEDPVILCGKTYGKGCKCGDE
jgi:hypothetical protein